MFYRHSTALATLGTVVALIVRQFNLEWRGYGTFLWGFPGVHKPALHFFFSLFRLVGLKGRRKRTTLSYSVNEGKKNSIIKRVSIGEEAALNFSLQSKKKQKK